ncbi:hypothetical protein ACHQM5_014305 [Ranunculus cassubicifolius]
MENTYPEVFDISSDDEESEEDELLNDMLRQENEDSDEVVVVGEVSGGNSKERQSKNGDSDDDECLILDGDPDKILEVENGDGNDEDELQVVGEKGQIACRDYPHPRHLCARYPFSSNPHEKYCDLCHCYVCDTRAPCKHWGTGVSSHDHCHSSDKEEIWRLQRKWYKEGITEPLSVPKIPVPPLAHKPVHSHPLNNGVPTSMKYNISKSATLRPCSSTTSYSVPNIIKNHHHQRPGSTRLPQHGLTTTTIRKPCVTAHPPSFKKVGPGRYGAGSFNSNLVSSQLISQQVRTHPKDTTSNGVQNTYQCASQPPLGGSFMAPQSQYVVRPQVYSHPIPQPVQATQHVYSHPLPQPVQATQQVYSQPIPQPVQAAQQAYSESISQPVQTTQQAYSQPIPQQPLLAPTATYQPVDLAHCGLNNSLCDYGLNWFNDTSQSHCPILENPEFPNVQPTATSQPPQMVQLSSVQPPTSGLTPVTQFTTVEPTFEPLPTTESTTIGSAEYELDWIHSLGNLGSGNDALSSDFGFIPSHSEMEASLLTFDFENP